MNSKQVRLTISQIYKEINDSMNLSKNAILSNVKVQALFKKIGVGYGNRQITESKLKLLFSSLLQQLIEIKIDRNAD